MKTNEVNPFTQKRTISYKVFEMAKKGTTLKAIENYAIKKGSDAAGAGRIIRILRRGEYRGERWAVNEYAGFIQVIIEEKKPNKKGRRLCN